MVIKNITRNIEDLVNMKYIVNAYEEIASMKMRRIRGNVIESRDLITELAEIYRQITTSYRNQILLLKKEKQMKNSKTLSLKEHNNKTACVYFSANSGLFGHILRKTYANFIAYLEQHPGEPVIIGTFGKELFEAQFPGREFVFLPLPDATGYGELLQDITDSLLEYENIVIFYAKFQTMTTQTITMLDMSGQNDTGIAANAPAPTYYFFEPSLEKILAFFEQEIFVSIMEQTFSESELARFASRIIALDSARENIDNTLKKIEREKRLMQHQKMNKKQLEAVRGISMLNLR